MKTIGPACAAVLLLPGCADGLFRLPTKMTGIATPPAAISAPKPRPAAPAVQVPPVATPQPTRKAPRPAATERPVDEAAPAPRSTAPVAAAEPVIAPRPAPEPPPSEPAAVAAPVAVSGPRSAPAAPTAAPTAAPQPSPERPQPSQAAPPTSAFTPIREPNAGTCDCPYDLTSSGVRCGGNSEWSRPGGYDPVCYLHQQLGPSLFTSETGD